jgi:MFS family permease
LSPIALGYLFSSFLWAYVLMMLLGGRLIDRWGTHVIAPLAVAVWSTAQMATGMVGNFATMLIVRLGIGIGEAPYAPISYSGVRSWSRIPSAAPLSPSYRVDPASGLHSVRRPWRD